MTDLTTTVSPAGYVPPSDPTGLVRCAADRCAMTFFKVEGRDFPELCLEHAADADRSENGWTPENSID